ncbi:hypothetical protein [Alteromonas oceanisediminis]|uniref:hypothetical protein n=1 Tax=Alteromonas oceanisediminis TaxID=2836180 RepID=UPI001BDA052D|nr:hypothetical protein [Alteromonas oceanisediminis]MBT0584857.1 hypothetical protein [Alteromonas oceanisediminis]
MKLNLSTWCKSAVVIATLCAAAPSFAQERTTEGMWMTEYNNMVENGLYALSAKNYDVAYEKLHTAAEWGSKEAQFYLAQIYLNGWGREPDYKQGWLWLNVALEQRSQEWRDAERQISRALPEDFIKAMQPFVEQHIATYGADAKDLRCVKRTKIGSNIKEIMCEKRTY